MGIKVDYAQIFFSVDIGQSRSVGIHQGMASPYNDRDSSLARLQFQHRLPPPQISEFPELLRSMLMRFGDGASP